MVAEYTPAKVFGEYWDRLDLICDGDEAARILTLRAANEEGIYRVYNAISLARMVFNGQLTAIDNKVGSRSYYLIEDVRNMHMMPERGRSSPSVATLQARLDRYLALGKKAKSARVEGLKREIALAKEAEQAVAEYWRYKPEEERSLTPMQRRLNRLQVSSIYKNRKLNWDESYRTPGN